MKLRTYLSAVALLATTTAVGAALPAAYADTEHQELRAGAWEVTAAAKSTEVEVGEKVRIIGTLAPGKADTKVVLQQKSGKSWSKVATKRTRDAGKFAFAFASTKAGRAYYRVTAPATAARGKGVSDKVRVDTYRWRYVTDLDWHDEGDWNAGSVTINGRRYHESVYTNNTFWGDLEVNLNGKCTELRGTAGLTDDSDTGTEGGLSISQDGSEIYYAELTMTATDELDIAVDGALRLAFRYYDLAEDYGQTPWVGVGNARVHCRS